MGKPEMSLVTSLKKFQMPSSVLFSYLASFLLLFILTSLFNPVRDFFDWDHGVILALLLIFGTRYTLLAIIGGFVYLVLQNPATTAPSTTLIWSIAMTGTYAGAATVLRQFLHVDLRFRRVRDAVLFSSVGLLTTFVLVLISLTIARLTGGQSTVPTLDILQIWTVKSANLMVIAPFLIVHHRYIEKFISQGTWKILTIQPGRAALYTLQGCALVIAMMLTFWLKEAYDFQAFYPIYLPLFWIALEQGIAGATLATLFINGSALFAVQHLGMRDASFLNELDVFLLIIALAALVMGSIVHERRESLKRFSKIFFASPNPVSLSSLETGKYLDVNDAFLQTLEFKRDEVIGATSNELQIFAKVEKREEMLEAVRNFRSIRNYECRLKTQSGQLREAIVSLELVNLGEQQAVIEMFNDITDNRMAEKEIQRLSSFPELNPNPILEVDFSGKVVFHNLATLHMMEKLDEKDVKIFLPDDIQDILKLLPHSKRTSMLREKHIGKSTFEMFLHFEPEFDSIRIYVYDVTNRKQSEVEIRQRVIELETLHEFGMKVGQILDPKEIGQMLIDILSKQMDWHHAVVRLRRNGGGKGIDVIALSHPGWSEEETRTEKVRLQSMISGVGKGLSGWTIEHGQTIRCGDVTSDPRYIETFSGIKSGLYVPLVVNDRTIGSIAVESEVPEAFDENDERLMTTLAAQVAATIENARLFTEIRDSLSREQRTNEITHAISSSLDLNTILQTVMKLTAELVNADSGVMAIISDDGRTLKFPHLFNAPENWHDQPAPAKGTGIIWNIIQSRKPILMGDYSSHPQAIPSGIEMGLKALLGIPLFDSNGCYGALILYQRSPDKYFTTRDLALVEAVGKQASIAIQNAKLFDETQNRMRELKALLQTYETISGTLDLEPLLEKILTSACNAIPAAEKGTIMLAEVDDSLRIRAKIGYTDIRLNELPFKGKSGYVFRVFTEKRPVLVRDARAEYKIPLGGEIDEVSAIQSAISAPLIHKDKVIGVISLDNANSKNAFSEGDLRLLAGFASSAAVSIDNARLFDETVQRVKELSILTEVSLSLRTASNREEMLPVILDELLRLLKVGGAAIALRNSDKDDTTVELGRGKWESWTGIQLSSGEGITGNVIDTGMAYFSNDVQTDDRMTHMGLLGGLRSVSCVPLTVEGKTFGALWMGQVEGITDNQQKLLAAIANIAANAIHRTSLHEKIVSYAYNLAVINALGRTLAASQDLKTIYRAAHKYIREIMDCTNFGISLVESEMQLLRQHFAVSNNLELGTTQFPVMILGKTDAADLRVRAIKEAQPFIYNNYEGTAFDSGQFPLWPGVEDAPLSAIFTPIVVEGKVIGLLDMQSHQADAYSQEDSELLVMIANQVGLAISNIRLFAESGRRIDQLGAMHEIDSAISASIDLRSILKIVIEHVRVQLKVDAANILLFNPHTLFLEFASGQGFHTNAISQTWVRLGEDLPGQVVHDRQVIHIPDLRMSAQKFGRTNLIAGESFVTYLGVPLIAKGQVKGVLELFHRSLLETDKEWFNFLEMISGQAAIAIDNATMFENLERANLELTSAYDATIEGWSRALELRDEETEGHTRRVTEMTLTLAHALGLNEEKLVHMRRGALLHDIGKIAVPDHILRKPGPLNDEEWLLMRRHPWQAYEMLSSIDYLRPALDIPHYHHEKWDGTGYPNGLKAEHIPLAARIFAVADVFDALTSDRPYRAAWTREKAINYIREQSGKHFDPDVVEMFMGLQVG